MTSMPHAASTWPAANQRYLVAALAVVRARLERHDAARHAAERNTGAADARAELEEAGRDLPAPANLDTLCSAFGLSPFERDLLLLCAGADLDSSFAALIAAAHGDARRSQPTFSLGLAVLPEAHWSALSPAGPLRRWRMIELGAGESLTSSPLRLDERVLHYLCGVTYLDERLAGIAEWVRTGGIVPPGSTSLQASELSTLTSGEATSDVWSRTLPPSHRAVAEQMIRIWRHAAGSHVGDGAAANEADDEVGGWPRIELVGERGADRRAIAAWACANLGLQLHAMQAINLPSAVAEREALARLWEREAALTGSALLLECDEVDTAEGKRAITAFVGEVQGMLVLSASESLGPERLSVRPAAPRLQVPALLAAEQRMLWQRAWGDHARDLDGQLDVVATQFNLGPADIQAVSQELLSRGVDAAGDDGNTGDLGAALWDACRAQARPRLEELAQRIEPVATWDDLILPEVQHETLRQIAAHVRQRVRVYTDWGFEKKSSRGLGISGLFAGASGTGKTMAAEVLAADLRLDLYRIDLSQVVSKYIGETEKNLRRVFDAAEQGGVVLLFDEADALFGRRSEVKDSHDRYANIEVSYLLQRMESYRGLAILTTNMKQALDPAFLRRIRFVVQFPFPDAGQRAEIWRRIFPSATPTEGLDLGRLARLNVAGGNIRNIALNAAFLAADAGEPVSMSHLLRAARSEYAKLEKPLTEAEFGGWV